jgi:hypothetical protein
MEIDSLDEYRLVYLTPDVDAWDPHLSSYAEDEDAMVDLDRSIAHYERRALASIFGLNADIEYYKPPIIDCFEAAVDCACDEFNAPSVSFDDDELASLSMDGIRSQVATLDGSLEPAILFETIVMENAHMSTTVAMALGSMTVNDNACDLFEAVLTTSNASPASVSAVTAGKPGGVSAECLAKLFNISHDDAHATLSTDQIDILH